MTQSIYTLAEEQDISSVAYKTVLLDNRKRADLDRAADLILDGEVVAFGFGGIFAFIGDADQEIAARRMAVAKQQSFDKPLALVCAPEYEDEFIDPAAPAFHYHPLDKIKQLQRDLFALGVFLPAARSGVPPYMSYNGTILNVWVEYPPYHPGRYLHEQIRRRGKRAMMGTSTNQHGESTYVDLQQVQRVFSGKIGGIVSHDLSGVPAYRRQSATLVDFTGERPRLVRYGSVPVEELEFHLDRLGLAPLAKETLAV